LLCPFFFGGQDAEMDDAPQIPAASMEGFTDEILDGYIDDEK
jgi:hypothetical protein